MWCLRRLIWTGAALVLCILQARAAASEPAKQRRPNLLFILTDDQRFDALGCAGNKIIQTPNVDAMAKDGVRFPNAFVTTSICPASRASIFTGLYERAHGYTFGTPPISDKHVDNSYPALLKKAGYRVGFVGKFCVGVPKGAMARMLDSFVPLPRAPHFRKEGGDAEKHFLDIEADKAIAFLDAVKPGEPFCLSISFNAPHAEDGDKRQFIFPPALAGMYGDVMFPVPKTMTEEFFNAQPEFLRNSESRVRFHWRF